jgi:tetratricopeptide (TPR) repeat protein
MRKASLFIALMALPGIVSASVTKPSAPIATDSMTVTQGKLAEAIRLQQSGNSTASMALLQEILQSPTFARLSSKEQQAAMLLGSAIGYQRGDYKVARDFLVRATSGPPNLPAWQARLDASYRIRDYRDAALCIAAIARQWPNELSSIRYSMIAIIRHELDAADASNQELTLLEALFDAHWVDENGDSNRLWFELTRLLIDRGAMAKASVVARSIHSARMTIAMRVDKRFDTAIPTGEATFDIDRVAKDAIQHAEAFSKEHPDKLAPLVHLQELLNGTLQYARVVTIADDINAKVADSKGPSVYKDFKDQYVWMLGQRSKALEGQGRWDEAIAQLTSAAQRTEYGAVTQAIDLANLEADLLRPKEALEALTTVDTPAKLGRTSSYGRMLQEIVLLKIAVQQKDKKDIATHMAYLRNNRDQAIGAWEDALLMTGDEDAAADLLIERLHSVRWRNDALLEMQNYADTPVTPFYQGMKMHWKNIIQQPKVLEAANEVGRIESFHLAG